MIIYTYNVLKNLRLSVLSGLIRRQYSLYKTRLFGEDSNVNVLTKRTHTQKSNRCYSFLVVIKANGPKCANRYFFSLNG